MTSPPALAPLDRDLWIATRPLPLIVGDVGTRMRVVRMGQELLPHSPVALDAQGRVRWVVGPNEVHHLYLSDYASAYPDAEPCAAPGPPENRACGFHRSGACPAGGHKA